MSEKLKRFTKLLKEMFELEKADLDFGIYRIMNLRKNEINNFIENTLSEDVKSILSKYATDNSHASKRIEEIEKQCESVGVKVEDSKLMEEYAEYKARLSSGTGAAELESDVYSALYNFFSRYYDEGDFISKRRYKEGVYAIPYEGEEVKLYWANHDQYYIKTSENFRDYSFKVDVHGEKFIIHFKLVDASTEQNNNKENGDKKREFILLDENFLEVQGNELTFKFEYRVAGEEQDSINKLRDNSKLNKSALDKMIEPVSGNADLKQFFLALNMPVPTEKNNTLTVLEKHLETYISKNTFDYFIHKDLSRFLNRELDFYIKSEVMNLDDLDTDNEIKVNTYLGKVKAIKQVGRTIIAFLAQIEEFQKKLWLKKKFVVDTNWSITLNKIDESFYSDIATNDEQRQEWIELFAIDEIEGNLMENAYSNPLTVEFLQQNKNLVLDTKHFSADFKERLISSIDDLDEETNGLLIHSDNFQALNLMQEKYKEKISIIHIDPPYNTSSSGFLYKNNYVHSSWMTMMHNRITIAVALLSREASFQCHIDEYEYDSLYTIYKAFNFPYQGTVIWDKRNPMMGGRGIAVQHEYIIWASYHLGQFIAKAENIKKIVDKAASIISKNGGVYEKTRKEFSDWIRDYEGLTGGERAYKYIADDGRVYRHVAMTWPNPNPAPPQFFIPLIHPKNNQPCPVPARGWSRTPGKMKELLDKGEIVFGNDETIQPQRKIYLSSESNRPVSSVIQSGQKGKAELERLGLSFSYCHPVSLYEETIYGGLHDLKGIVLDFFAGSGTTGHAVINLNREDEGNRKYILVEMGNYFNTVTKPRIKKVIYSKDWKDGKPQNRNTGVSQIFKYVRLESYEDTLNNIDLSRSPEQKKQLDLSNKFFNEYLVSYMLDIESRDSLLNLDLFKTPFDYKMKITENNETQETAIDLVETFNYLLGLTVTKQGITICFSSTPDAKGKYENSVKLTENKSGKYGFKAIEGLLPNGNKVLVIWRNLTGDLVADNAALDAFFMKYHTNVGTGDFDVIYVNGDNNLENLRTEKEQWKVHLIELEFKKRMFEEV
ncbi:MAG: site-specific DNA-methyltransferase [Clostridia bacterium]|nr:site-specific DNA-methyltransferase [Clostridia bacterium]